MNNLGRTIIRRKPQGIVCETKAEDGLGLGRTRPLEAWEHLSLFVPSPEEHGLATEINLVAMQPPGRVGQDLRWRPLPANQMVARSGERLLARPFCEPLRGVAAMLPSL